MTPGRFRRFIAIDWSGAKGERHKGIAVAEALQDGPPRLIAPPAARWSRDDVADLIAARADSDVLVGMDLGIALPFADAGAYFPGWAETPPDAAALWALIDRICAADPHLGAASFVAHDQAARYFRHSRDHVGDRFHLPDATTREGRFRVAEHAQRALGVRPVSNFNLVGAAQVGKASLTGMRMLHRLRGKVSVWPIDPLPARGAVLVEMYTAIAARGGGARKGRTKLRRHEDLDAALARLGSPLLGGRGEIDDHTSDALLTAAWLRTIAHCADYWHPKDLTPQIARTEGWTFGAT